MVLCGYLISASSTKKRFLRNKFADNAFFAAHFRRNALYYFGGLCYNIYDNFSAVFSPVRREAAQYTVHTVITEEDFNFNGAKENCTAELDAALLDILLKDGTTGKNILWATDNYEAFGARYSAGRQILPALITGSNGEVVKRRINKSKEEQQARIRGKAEVVTPSWICNCQNNLVDGAWFGYDGAFNTEGEKCWQATSAPVKFPEGKDWRDYVRENRLEITCGEAPYLASRYDTVTGKPIPVKQRIGLLDRKLRVVGENTQNKADWAEWAKEAYKSVYGYEWQGDNLLFARENLLYTCIDFYAEKFKEQPDRELLLEIAEIISWNIWQMDGLKFIVPESFAAPRSGRNTEFCKGYVREEIYCKIKNWQTGKAVRFSSLMGAKAVFAAIVGNPPYQVPDGGAQASAKPVYNLFVDICKKASRRYLSVIMPARWYAGGKGLEEFRNCMLADRNIVTLVDYPNSADCFPALGDRNIKGGICYFLRDAAHCGKCTVKSMRGGICAGVSQRYLEGGCGIFIRDAAGASVLEKVKARGENCFADIVSPRKPFGLATDFREFSKEKTSDGQIVIYAFKSKGYVDVKKIKRNADWADKYKLFVPEAIGEGDVSTDVVKPVFGGRGTCCTETYLVVGPFPDEAEAKNCLSYINTKFFHFLLSLKKITQHTTKKCYGFIPLKDFTEEWNDEKLFAEYGFTEEEKNYILNTVWAGKGE